MTAPLKAQETFGITIPDDEHHRPSPRMTRICPQCEYDLTGLPEPCVCPECGERVEVGLRYIYVWPYMKRPTWLNTVALVAVSLMSVLIAWSAYLRTGLSVVTFFIGSVALLFLFATCKEVKKMCLQLKGTSSTRLHASPNRVGTTTGRRVRTIPWGRVTGIKATRAFFGGWYLIVQGNGLLAFNRAGLLMVYMPYSRRTAAHVRNTLRRHHRAWKQAQVEARRV